MKKIMFSFAGIKNMSTFATANDKQTLQSECSAVGSALRSGRRGRAFESPHSDEKRQMIHIICRFFILLPDVNNSVIILCDMRLFISLQVIG